MLGRSHLYSNGQLIHRFEAKNNALSLGDVSAYFNKRDLWVVALNVSVYDFWGASKTDVATPVLQIFTSILWKNLVI